MRLGADVHDRGGPHPLAARDTRWPSIGRPQGVPIQPKSIIGREQELALASELLARPDVRLLTLTGPPGVGKTRLAIELAHAVVGQFASGACFVDLAPVSDARLVVDALAVALGLRDLDRRVAASVVEEFLRDKSLLLVLDNFEHVLDAVGLVGNLLSACAYLKVVATSRAPLHLQWETEQPVAPLAVPPRAGTSEASGVTLSPAGELFAARARAVAPDFVLDAAEAAAVAEICARLDGLPLAIELAAARTRLLPPRALLRRLLRDDVDEARDSPLRLLAAQERDLPPRQQTLLRAIAWSYDLLEPDERALFRRLSVFVDGCTIEAAEALCADDISGGLGLIASLVDKSLVWREVQPDGEPRLRMLETIRDYAGEQLAAADEVDAIRRRAAEYYITLAEHAARGFAGAQQPLWFARLEHERANIEAVERWAAARGERRTLARLAGALWPFWLARENASHARERLDMILQFVDAVPADSSLAAALHAGGLLAEKLGDYATCRSLLERDVALARELDDRAMLAALLDSLGRQSFIEGRYAEARALLVESNAILEDSDNRTALARVLSHFGFLEFLEGRTTEARAVYERGLALARAASDQHRVAEFMDNLGNTSAAEGDLDRAAEAFEEAIRIWRELGQGPWLAMALNNLGKIEIRKGEHESARGHLLEALSLAHRMGNRRRMAYVLLAVGSLAAAEGDAAQAGRLQAVAATAMAEMGAAPPAQSEHVGTAVEGAALPLERAVEQSIASLIEQVQAAQEPAPNAPARRTRRSSTNARDLSGREREVVSLVTRGLTNRQIAEALVITEGTAENYVQRILAKLGFNNRAQIAAWGVEHGLATRPTI